MHSDSDESFQLDEICDEFENEWREGRIPDIVVWSSLGNPAIRPALLRRLVAIDHIHRLRTNLADLTPPRGAALSDVSPEAFSSGIVDGQKSSGQSQQTIFPDLIPPDDGNRPAFAIRASPVPESIGGCQILQEIGHGGMGIVYKAWQPGVNRNVAVKLLHPSVSGGISIKQFQAEATATGRLHHSGIVQVFSAGQENNARYLIMEFVDGPNLEEFIGGQLISGKQTAQIALEVAEALSAMHDKGVIHRDIKPANILIARDKHPKIADFGLARLEDSGLSMTATGTIVGTPSYMSPEQARGDVRSVTASVDIYALGGIIYRCLTGRPPFNAPRRLEVIEQILRQEPIPLHQLNRDVEPDLEIICLRCLQKDPTDRPMTAGFLAEELQRFLNNEPILMRPISRYQQMLRWCRRHPRVAMMRASLAALMFMVLTGIPLLLWQASLIAIAGQQQQLGEKTISESKLREELQQERVDQAEESAKEHAHVAAVQKYYATLMEAGEVRAAKELGWTWKTISLIQRAAATKLDEIDSIRLRSLAADAMTSIDALKVETFCEGLRIDDMGISHDGSILALPEVRANPTANVHLFSIATGESSDAQKPFQVSPSRVLSMNTVGDKLLSFFAGTGFTKTLNPGFRCAAFSRDGRYCATGTRNGELILWDLSTAESTRVYEKEFEQQELDQILFSSDDRLLFIRHNLGRCLRTLDRETGDELAKRDSDIRGIVMLPEGRLLLAEAKAFTVVNAESLEPVDESTPQEMLDAYRRDESPVFTAQGEVNVDVFDARTLLPGTSTQRVAYSGTWVYSHRSMRDAATIIGTIDPSIARIWDGLSGRHIMDLLLAGSVVPHLCVDERAHRLFLMTGGVGTAFQIRAPGSGTDGQPATEPDGAIMDFIAPGARNINSFELNPADDEIALFEYDFSSDDPSRDSLRWQVRRMNLETRETLASWSFCKLHSEKSAIWGAKPLGLTYAGNSGMLYLATSMPNGLFRLSEDGFDVLDKTLSPSLRIAPAAVSDNIAEFQIPEVVRKDCEHVRISVACFAPRALDVEHESITLELQTDAGIITAAATGRQLSERGWYLLEVAIVPRDHLSRPTRLTCRLQSDGMALSGVSDDASTSMLIGDLLLFPQTTGKIHNYTIGPLAGLANGTLAAVSPEESVQFWNDSSEQPLDRWADVKNNSPGFRAIAASTDRVLVGTRFGNAFVLQQEKPAWRILGNDIDEGVENGHSISSVEFSRDEQLALIGRKDGSVVALDLTERPARDLQNGIHMKNEITSIAISGDRRLLAVGDRDGILKLWRIDADSFSEWFQLSNLQSPVRKLRFSPDESKLYLLCDHERAVRVLHLSNLNSEFEKLGIPTVAGQTR